MWEVQENKKRGVEVNERLQLLVKLTMLIYWVKIYHEERSW
jgi:hypothetical protein